MSVSIPSTSNDMTALGGLNTVPPPVNTADGDVLVAVILCRNTGITPPGSWTTLLSSFTGANGDGIIQYLPVPSAASLPANWTWNTSTQRMDIFIFRVVGMNVSSPVFQVGTPVAAGSDGPGALPVVLPGITAGGAAMAAVFTFFTESVVSSDFVPGFSLFSTCTTPTAGVGRSSAGLFSSLITGATGNVTTANDWPSSPAGQDGVLLGFSPAVTSSGPAYTASMSSM